MQVRNPNQMQLVTSGAKFMMPESKSSELPPLPDPAFMRKGLGGKQTDALHTLAAWPGGEDVSSNSGGGDTAQGWATPKFTTSQRAVSPCLRFFR